MRGALSDVALSGRRRTPTKLLLACLCVHGCAQPLGSLRPQPKQPSEQVSYRFLPSRDHAPSAATNGGKEEAEAALARLIPPTPDPANVLPRYPNPENPAPGSVLVALRIVVNTRGSVVSVDRSPLAPAENAPREFGESATDAVRRWRFAPALFETRTGEFSYQTKAIASYLDVQFTFDMLDGAPGVQAQ